MPASEHERVTRIVLAGILAYVAVGASIGFFWFYAIWILLKQDRFLEAAVAFVLAPLGAIYGALRFFGWL